MSFLVEITSNLCSNISLASNFPSSGWHSSLRTGLLLGTLDESSALVQNNFPFILLATRKTITLLMLSEKLRTCLFKWNNPHSVCTESYADWFCSPIPQPNAHVSVGVFIRIVPWVQVFPRTPCSPGVTACLLAQPPVLNFGAKSSSRNVPPGPFIHSLQWGLWARLVLGVAFAFSVYTQSLGFFITMGAELWEK